MRRTVLLAGIVPALCFLSACAASRPVLRGGDGVPYPPAQVAEGEIYHIPTGLRLNRDQALDLLSGARVVYVGEMHNNLNAHKVQLEVIRGLEERYPGRVAIGMEMFREPQQPALDRWSRGELDEIEFLRDVRWFQNWGSDFGYYREILTYARDHRIDVVALKPDQEKERLVRGKDWSALTDAERARLPEIGEEDRYQRASIDAVSAGHLPTEGMASAFRRIQILWEESMAEEAVDYLRSERGAGKRLVVIAGGGHLEYGFGIPKKVMRRMPAPYAILMPEEISIPEEKREELVMAEVIPPELPLLKADLVWMVPYEDLEDRRIRLGIVMDAREGMVTVTSVEPSSPAADAGVLVGDRIVSLDGRRIAEPGDLRAMVGVKSAGEKGLLRVVREGKEIDLTVAFRAMAKPAEPK
jgi:uncharacterized iron-regulated protein